MKYFMNGAVFYSHGVAPTYPLLVDSALGANAIISNTVIAGAP